MMVIRQNKKQVHLRYLSVRYIPASEYTVICIMNEPAVSTFGLECRDLECRDWNVEPVQQILVKLTNHNEA